MFKGLKKNIVDGGGWRSPETVQSLPGAVLLIYLAVYFLIPYKPWDAPLSFHAPLLAVGLVVSLFRFLHDIRDSSITVSKNLVFLVLAVTFFLISSAINYSKDSSFAVIQAYSLSFLCLVFVGGAFDKIDLSRLYLFMKIYLVVSGILIILQTNFAGPFYVASFFGIPNPGSGASGWGFAASHIFAGGAIAWMFCVILSRYVLSYKERLGRAEELLYLFSIGLGAVGVFYSFSRGAWLAVFLAVALFWAGSAWRRLPQWRMLKALAFVLFSLSYVQFVFPPVISRMDQKLLFIGDVLKNPDRALARDASAFTRLKAWGLSADLIKANPVWGVGFGRFPALYSRSFHELYKGLAADRFDPSPLQTSSNSYLYYAVEAGLLPAFFLFGFMALVFYKAFKAGMASPFFPFFTGGLAVCFWMMTCDYIGERFFWIMMGSLAGPAFILKREK